VNASSHRAWRDVLTAVRRQPGTICDVARRSGWCDDHTRRCLIVLERVGCVTRDPGPKLRRVYRATYVEPPETLRVTAERVLPWGALDAAIVGALDEPRSSTQIAHLVGSYRQLVQTRLYSMERSGHVTRDRSTHPHRWSLIRRPKAIGLAERVVALLDSRPRRALDLAADLDVEPDLVRRALRELEAVGRAEALGRGRSGATMWRLPSTGPRAR